MFAVGVLDAVEARKRGDLDTLIDLLADTDYRTRWSAAVELGRLGDPSGVPPLIRALQASDDGLRVLAIKSLAQIGDVSVVPSLIEVTSRDPASGVRVTAVDALARLGDPRGIDMLVDLALDPAPPIILTSERMQRPADGARLFARAVSTKDNEIRQTRRWALKRLRELRVIEALGRLEAAPRPRSPRTRLARARTVRALRRG